MTRAPRPRRGDGPRPGSAAVRRTLTGLLLVLLLPGCAYFNTFYNAKRYYSQAQKSEEKSRETLGRTAGNASELYRKSIDQCRKVIERYPGSKWQDDAHLLMAKGYFGRADYLSAEEALEKFDTEYRDSELYAEAISWRGRTAFAQADYADALRIWGGLLEQFADFEDREEVELQMAEALWHDEQLDAAETAFHAFLTRHPKSDLATSARLDLGELLLKSKRYEESALVFEEVAKRAKQEEDRLEARLFLGEALEAQHLDEEALDLYTELAEELDPTVFAWRLSDEDRERLLDSVTAEAALQDSIQKALAAADTTGAALAALQNQNQTAMPADQMNRNGGKQRNAADPREQKLAQVLLREGRVRARIGDPEKAIEAFEQVVTEFPRSAYAAEAQYRIGYTYEVAMEDFDEAQLAYADVSRQGVSTFRDDAARRAKNLSTVKNLLAAASADSASQARNAAAEARFMRAELYLFQQENSDRAIEEYRGIEREFAGTEYAAKAGLALAWVAGSTGDSTAALDKYTEVASAYPYTEYGRRARYMVHGPEPEPDPESFAGPSLAELTDPENLALMTIPEDTVSVPGPELATRETAPVPTATPKVTPPPSLPSGSTLGDFVKQTQPAGTVPVPVETADPTVAGIPSGATGPVATRPADPGEGAVEVATSDPAVEDPRTGTTTATATADPGTALPTPGTSSDPAAAVPSDPEAELMPPTPDPAAVDPGRIPILDPGATPGAEPAPNPDRPAGTVGAMPLGSAPGPNPLLPVGTVGDSLWAPRRYQSGAGDDTGPPGLVPIPGELYLDPLARPGAKDDPTAVPPKDGKNGAAKPASADRKQDAKAAETRRTEAAKTKAPEKKTESKEGSSGTAAAPDSTSGKGDP